MEDSEFGFVFCVVVFLLYKGINLEESLMIREDDFGQNELPNIFCVVLMELILNYYIIHAFCGSFHGINS